MCVCVCVYVWEREGPPTAGRTLVGSMMSQSPVFRKQQGAHATCTNSFDHATCTNSFIRSCHLHQFVHSTMHLHQFVHSIMHLHQFVHSSMHQYLDEGRSMREKERSRPRPWPRRRRSRAPLVEPCVATFRTDVNIRKSRKTARGPGWTEAVAG